MAEAARHVTGDIRVCVAAAHSSVDVLLDAVQGRVQLLVLLFQLSDPRHQMFVLCSVCERRESGLISQVT